jgi:MtaA/CmuA family methyltransferase
MTYSAMDRFKDALKGEPQDRVPIFPLIGGWAPASFSPYHISRIVMEPELIADAQIKAKESVGYDALYAYADSLYIPDAFGCEVRFPETGPLLPDPLPVTISSPEDIETISFPDVREGGRLPVIHETVRLLSTYGRDDLPVVGLFEGPFTTTCRIIEAEQIMRMTYKRQEVLEVLLDKMNRFLMEFGHTLIEDGANVLFIPEPTSSSSMISPTMFRRFVLPRLQRLIQGLNVPCILHICGDTLPILDAMGEAGASVLSLDQCMDLSESRQIVPGGVLGGNVDPINSLLMGTQEQVAHNTLQCLRSGGTSRFILMSGCGVPPNTSIGNLKTMIETAVAYGLGPKKD